MRKSMYIAKYGESDDEKYNTAAHEFSNEITNAIKPIIKSYYERGFKIRELIGLSMEACYIKGLEEYGVSRCIGSCKISIKKR
jgi:hypothetical protein